jgi:hypothetical protein
LLPEAAEPFARQVAGHPAAARLWTERCCPYEAARALAESDAEAPLREALAAFERLGAQPMAAVVARRLRERGIDDAEDGTPLGVEFLNASRGVDLADIPQAAEIAATLRARGFKVLEVTGAD